MKVRVFRGYEIDEYWTNIAQRIADRMREKYKLDFPNIDYYFVSLDEMASIVATHGWIVFPSSWEEGQRYYLNKIKQKLIGESIIEIVVPSYSEKRNTPIKAYINSSYNDVAKKLVIAHVLGHAHIYKNNVLSRRFKIEDPISFFYRLLQKINEYEILYGEEEVQEFIENIKHLSTLIDLYPSVKIQKETTSLSQKEKRKAMEKFLIKEKDKIPKRKEYDILKFLEKYAPLEKWQRDLLKSYRKLFYFLYSTGSIKILHEGFSSLVELIYFLDSDEEELPIKEWISYAELSAQRELPLGSLIIKEDFNPYFLGFKLLMHGLIKLATGEYNKEFLEEKTKWYERISREDLKDIINKPEFIEAWRKILDKVNTYDDFLLIKNLFDLEFFNSVARKHYFVYEGENYLWYKKIVVSRSYKDILTTFLFSSYNLKLPRVYIPRGGGEYNKKENEDRGELLLVQDTSFPEMLGIQRKQLTLYEKNEKIVLEALYKIWKKPVNIKTFDVEFEPKKNVSATSWFFSTIFGVWHPEMLPSLEERSGKIIEVIDRFDGNKFEKIKIK
ncbi:MAG: SpoVR family protein [Candidatus Aenigmarchaeota archaeon]|nr:SpoVR family protein [Candidatus Aenigmarchaeota archaeon]MDW8149412.1 SpoVR family protein [Candidatus Aenigmarchaeota archaeon]